MVGQSNAYKIPTFGETGPWVLHNKQFEAAAVHNQWINVKEAVALIVYLKRLTQQVLGVKKKMMIYIDAGIFRRNNPCCKSIK